MSHKELGATRREKILAYIETHPFLARLVEPTLVSLLRRRIHPHEKLTKAESAVVAQFISELKVEKRKTKKPVIIAMVGLVGSGKSSVARAIARESHATVVEGDAMRTALSTAGLTYDHQRKMSEDAAIAVVEGGGNVVFDADFMPLSKRASLRARAKAVGAEVIFVRATCDYDVMSQRVRESDAGPFFNKASSASTATDKGKDVKMREMHRRTPHHYTWKNVVGGKWTLKNPNFKIFATIDTTKDGVAETEGKAVGAKIVSSF